MRTLAARLLPTLLLAALALAAGCAGAPKGPRKPPLPKGDGVYTLRHNPPTCLVDRPALHAEMDTALGWERVALEDADDEVPVVAEVIARLRAAPGVPVKVAGALSSETRTWLGSHAARVLRVEALDPPEPGEDEAPAAPE
ncbi:MAG: hypothetical protein KC613_11885 [Myxococcales bacterium]|nr:hypothetical protein [Myxococcales bacterium]MCB9522416.1 hypothetical protein [Myxococcales bacterium]